MPRETKAPVRYVPTPKVFSLEIDAQPVLSFEAKNAREASELPKEEWFRAEMRDRRSNGRPLWDGAALLRVRPASDDEETHYRKMLDEAADEHGDLFLAFHVTLDGRAA